MKNSTNYNTHGCLFFLSNSYNIYRAVSETDTRLIESRPSYNEANVNKFLYRLIRYWKCKKMHRILH